MKQSVDKLGTELGNKIKFDIMEYEVEYLKTRQYDIICLADTILCPKPNSSFCHRKIYYVKSSDKIH